VRVTVVPSSIAEGGGPSPGQYLISYLINDAVAIDAGCLGLYRTPQEQARVKHVLISHSHIDHTATLPIFLENAFESKADCVTVYGSDGVLADLCRDVFNDRAWPDFLAISDGSSTPLVRFERIEPYRPLEVEGLSILPVPVDHVVPTLGFVITEGPTSVVIASDTGPTEEIWRVADEAPGLAAVFLEASFPDAMAELAGLSMHLTPSLFGREVSKIKRSARVLAVHIKPRFRARVIAELSALDLPNVEIARIGHGYHW
jgi:ribonuclease BN (tRNA processing enzyme)